MRLAGAVRICGAVLSVLVAGGVARAAEAPDFATFLKGVRAEALERHVSAATVDAAFAGLAPLPRVIELDRHQPEFTMTFAQYMAHIVNPARVARGREMMRKQARLLREVSRRYHVPARYVVALWGIETDFGRVTGNFPVIRSLATLAYDGRRSAYFRNELLNALIILDQEHMKPSAMEGSWAGAMGQGQFMPTTYLKYAVDFDGDGKRDIWTDRADVLGSIGHFLTAQGWQDGKIWGRAVRLPKGFDAALAKPDVQKTVSEWRRLGLRRADGGMLPQASMKAQLVLPGGAHGPGYLLYDNFQVFMKWNRSTFFGIAAGTLADRLAGR